MLKFFKQLNLIYLGCFEYYFSKGELLKKMIKILNVLKKSWISKKAFLFYIYLSILNIFSETFKILKNKIIIKKKSIYFIYTKTRSWNLLNLSFFFLWIILTLEKFFHCIDIKILIATLISIFIFKLCNILEDFSFYLYMHKFW